MGAFFYACYKNIWADRERNSLILLSKVILTLGREAAERIPTLLKYPFQINKLKATLEISEMTKRAGSIYKCYA